MRADQIEAEQSGVVEADVEADTADSDSAADDQTGPPPTSPPKAERGSAGRWVFAGIGLVATLLVGVLAGGVAFMNTSPTLRPPAVDLSPDAVASAKDSVSSAKMMIDLMSSAVNSSTSGIEKIVASIEPTFASIDTAASAANQMEPDSPAHPPWHRRRRRSRNWAPASPAGSTRPGSSPIPRRASTR